MKINSKKLIMIVKICLDAAWYLNFALAGLALVLMLHGFSSEEFTNLRIEVNLPKSEVLSKIDMKTDQVKDVQIATKSAYLTMYIKNTPLVITLSLLLLAAVELLVFVIIYNLRKVFSSLNIGYAFTSQNIRSLKQAAFWIALIVPLKVILYMCAKSIINFNIPRGHHLSVGPALDLKVLLIAVILYIVAEIFNSGLELKKENEEFV